MLGSGGMVVVWRRTLTGITSEPEPGLPRVVEQPWEFCGDWEVVDLAHSMAPKGLSTPKKMGDMGLVGASHLPGASKTEKEPERWAEGFFLLKLMGFWALFYLLQAQRKGPLPVHNQTQPH